MFPLITAAAHAQELRGTVRDTASARPIPGAVVLLLGADGRTVSRNITNERGEYRVALAPATTRARFLRLGFRPRELTIPASVGGVARLDVSMESIAAILETVQVSANPSCPRRSDETQAFALLEQARAALLASVVSRETNRASLVRYAYDRTHDGTSDRITRMTVRVDSAANTSSSFSATHSARDFVRRGFMEEGPSGQVFNAPDAEVLLDSAFSNAYCFRLLTDRDRARQVGLGFSAAHSEKKRVDVDGVLWVDTSARALSEIQFVYKGIDPSVDKLKPGGMISFHEMPNGSVMIDRWNLRLIGAFIDTTIAASPGGITEPEERTNFYIHEGGGELAHARWPDGTTWDGSLSTLQATARTRNGVPAPRAQVWFPGTPYRAITDGDGRIEIHDLVPGPYKAVIVDSALLAIDLTIPTNLEFSADRATTIVKSFIAETPDEFVVDRCIADNRYRPTLGDTTRVIARYFDLQRHPLDKVRWQAWSSVQNDWVQVREGAETGTDGALQLCSPALLRGGTLEIRGRRDGKTYVAHRKLTARVNVIPIVLAPATTVANVDFSRPPAPLPATTAVLAGFVFTDSTRQPIGGAEVSLPELGRSVLSDEKGQFQLTDVPPGEQHVQVRRIGYGLADTKLQFVAGQTVVRRFVLSRAVTLQAVDVNAEGVRIPTFDEHKHVGLGHFMERADIAKYDGMKMASVLQGISGVDVPSTRTAAYVMSRRAPPPNRACKSATCLENEGYYVATPVERQYGTPAVGCYSLVYVDGMLMNGSKEPTEPFDVNQIPPDRVEAIEYYAGPSETPLEYSRMGSKCGVLVIWTSIRKK
jgi:hypothetical protein